MRWGAKQRLLREQARAIARRRALDERPYEARRGIHGPYRFRSLLGAQGWVDANWPPSPDGAEAVIVNALSGARYRREGNVWRREGGEPEPEAAVASEPEPPYWRRPLC